MPSRNTAIDTFTRPVLGAALASLVSLAGLSGCSTSRHTGAMTLHEKAGLAKTSIDEGGILGEYNSAYYDKRANEARLPTEYLSEAHRSTAQLEAQRAAAQSVGVVADANLSESLSFADAQFEQAVANHDSSLAQAERMRRVFDARTAEVDEKINAKLVVNEASHDRNERLVGASVKEWRAEVERMRSGAEADWTQALAEHERMISERQAVQERGTATIEQMVKAANLTEERARQKVQSLRADSRAIAEQTDASVADLNQQIKTLSAQTDASVADLTQRARSLQDESAARVNQLLADAEALEKQNAQEAYELAKGDASVAYNAALAETEELRQSAQSDSQRFRAEIERQHAQATEANQLAQATLAEGRDWVNAQHEKMLAEVSVTRAQADAVENEARGRFIQAEIDARVEAIREQAAHDTKLAEDEFKRIKSEAIAEARKLEAQLAKKIASQVKSGAVTLESFTSPKGAPSADDKTPTLTRAHQRNAVVEPERISEFRISLAKAAMLRQQAEAQETDAHALRDAEHAKLSAWWEEKVAQNQAWHAKIDAEERKMMAGVQQTLARADAIIASAEAERNRALVEADSARKDTLARIASLRATAETTRRKSTAKAQQLLARADSTRRNGQSRIEALEVQRDATIRRGSAKSRQLLVEADSLETSQAAVVAQMQEEIKAANKILVSELARLDQAAVSYLAIAKANYQEGVAMADTFERVAVANTAELTAQHLAAHKAAQADIDYMRDLSQAQALARQAEVDRFQADAGYRLAQAEASDSGARAQAEALHRIAQATVDEQFAVASAQEHAVAARFDSRVASTESDHNRAYAEVYLARQQERARTQQAVASAKAFEELSSAALTRLDTAANAFNKTAQTNWSSRLAMPPALPAPTPASDIYDDTQPDADIVEFVVVPTDFE